MASRAFRRRAAGLIILAMALAAAPAGAATERQARPPRIAVTGAYPTGCLGLLARCGLPRDVLLEYQLSNLDLVSRYDLVIVAGAGDLATWTAIDKILARGVNVLQDSSSQLTQIQEFLDAMQRKGQDVKWAGTAQKPAKAPFKLVGAGNPLRPFLPAGESTFDAGFVGLMPPVEQGSTVLAEFGEPEVAGAQVPSGLLFLGRTPLEAGKPAIVLTSKGKAKRVLCGPTIGYDLSLMGADYDHLVLALVRLLTDGRAVQQLDSEAVHLSRKHSAGAAAPPELAAPAYTVPERPDGPGARAALPAGFTSLEEDPATEFNVSGTVGGAGEILLGHWNSANTLRVRLAATGITIARTAAGKPQPASPAAGALPAGTPFAAKVRASRLTVVAGALRAIASLQGACRGAAGWRGALADVRYQPVEPPTFADDFMRTSDDKGGWDADGGEWRTAIAGSKDLGANPFCYRVTTAGDAPATAVNGYAFWDDYRLSVSVRPEDAGGEVALGVSDWESRQLALAFERGRRNADEELAKLAQAGGSSSGGARGGIVGSEESVWQRLNAGALEALARDAAGQRTRFLRAGILRQCRDYLRDLQSGALAQGLGLGKGPQDVGAAIRDGAILHIRNGQAVEQLAQLTDAAVGVTYSDGSIHSLQSYGQMAARTGLARAQTEASALAYQAAGVHLVKVPSHGTLCYICEPWEGKVFALDEAGEALGYPRMPREFPLHPHCQHSLAPYVVEINGPGEKMPAAVQGMSDRELYARMRDEVPDGKERLAWARKGFANTAQARRLTAEGHEHGPRWRERGIEARRLEATRRVIQSGGRLTYQQAMGQVTGKRMRAERRGIFAVAQQGGGTPGSGGASGGAGGQQRASDAAHAALERIETQIRHGSVEELHAVDAAGNVVLQKRGSHDRIVVTAAEAGRLRGAYVTHNHTVVTPFSPLDVRRACEIGYQELRVVDAEWRYVMEPRLLLGRPGWTGAAYASDVEPAFRKAMQSAMSEAAKENRRRRQQGLPIMTAGEREAFALHLAWERTASDTGLFSYRKERF